MGAMPVRAWFDLARAGNLPSVASNVLAAAVLSLPPEQSWPAAGPLALAFAGGGLVYAGGATLNDVVDAGFDARHRHERPIPRGLITRRRAAWVAGLEMAGGLALLLAAGAAAGWVLGLAAAILAYDWLHKRWVGAVALMAACRVLLAVAVASLPGHAPPGAFVGWAAALFVYIVLLSLVARRESQPGTPATPLRRNVALLLACLPLLDAAALLLTGAWVPAMACAAAVPGGRWAQRLAAAT
jgi:4-hydroxybenzoate polyprenyltransferase